MLGELSTIDLLGLACIAAWAISGFSFLFWSTHPSLKTNWAETVRRRELAVKASFPWTATAYIGLFFFMFLDGF